MRRLFQFVWNAVAAGVLVLLPFYLAILLLMRAAKSIGVVVRPIIHLLPTWFPAEKVLSVVLVLSFCFLVGIITRTSLGRAARTAIENSVLQKLPGYTLFRSLTKQLIGDRHESAWKPALAEIEEALVPAFIIEELDDGRFTVFVPSVPTPLAGTVYILTAERVHPLDVPFSQAVKAVARWGSGSKDLVAAMQRRPSMEPGDADYVKRP